METVRRVRAALPPACTLLGFAGGPFTVACYMVEGGGSRDFAATRTLSYSHPVFFDRLIELLVQGTVEYLAAQIEAGADAVMLFDSWAGILPPRQFASRVIAPTAAIVAALNQRFPGVKIIGFPRLAARWWRIMWSRPGWIAWGWIPVWMRAALPPGCRRPWPCRATWIRCC